MTPAAIIFESPDLWPLAVLIGGILTVAVLWLYPPQLRAAGHFGWIVPLLRWAAVCLLALALLKPVLLVPKSTQDLGAVLFLVDCSKSMSVADPGRTPAEQVALAAALGRLPAGLRTDISAPVADLLRRLESRVQKVQNCQSDLEYARVSGRGIVEKQADLHKAMAQYAVTARSLAALSPALPVGSEFRAVVAQADQVPSDDLRESWDRVAERIGRMKTAARNLQRATDEQLFKTDASVRKACAALASLPRIKLAEDALVDPNAGLVTRLNRSIPMIGLAIDRGLQPIALPHQGPPARGLKLKADDHESDLTGAVTAAMGESSRSPVRALVLLSDGRQVGGRGGLTSAARPSGIPVLTVNIAPVQTPDVSISNVSLASTSAFAGETLEGQVSVRHDGIKAPAELHVDAAASHLVETLAPRPARDRPERADEVVGHFALTAQPAADEPEERITFSVPPQPGETTVVNNRVTRWIKVSSNRVRVIACSASPTWDFQYLRGTLSGRPWVDLDSELLDLEHPKLDISPEQILSADVLVLDGVPVDALDVAQWDAISQLVSARGKSVILIAATSYPIADYAGQPVARGLLPFHDVRPAWKQWPGEQPAFRFVPTPLGEQEALRLGDGPDGGLRRWQELPGVYRYLQMPDSSLYPDVRRLLTEADSGAAVLTDRIIGYGHVLFLGLDETWRWRLKASDRDSGRFWRQLVRYAAGPPFAATKGHLSLDVTPIEIRPGETVRVRASIGPGKLPIASANTCAVEVMHGGKVIGIRHLQAVGAGRFEAALSDWAAGEYQLRIRGVGGDNTPVLVHVPLHVMESDEAEMRNVSGNPGVLERIARSTGGEAFTLDQLDRVCDRLSAGGAGESQFARHELWNSPFLFTFVLACLAGEWALRKRFGLA